MLLPFPPSAAHQAQSLGSLSHRFVCLSVAGAVPAVPSSMPGMSQGTFQFSQAGSEGLLVSSGSRRESTACSSLGTASVLQFQCVLALS